jgi:hypothetical protein
MPNYYKENRGKILLQVDIIIQTLAIFIGLNIFFGERTGWNGLGTFFNLIIIFVFFVVWATISTFLLIFWQPNKSLLVRLLSIIKAIFAVTGLIWMVLFLIFLSTGIYGWITYFISITFYVIPFLIITFYLTSVLNFIISISQNQQVLTKKL